MSFAAYRLNNQSQTLSEQLAGYAGEDWQQAINHSFTEQLGDDTLADDVYARYLVQDYAFIETLANMIARAIADAPVMPQKTALAGFLAALTSDENTYFLRSFEALGVAEGEYLHPPLTDTAKGIIKELNDASVAGYPHAITVMCCAEWCYLSWAKQQARKTTPKRFYLSEWIDLHVLPEFETFVNWLCSEVDKLSTLNDEDLETLAGRFVRVSRLEHEFFTEALAPKSAS